MANPKTDPSRSPADPLTSRRSVVVGLVVAVAQTVALGVAAHLTGSIAMRTQTVTNVADVAVGAFVMLGVLSSARVADASSGTQSWPQ